MHFHILFQASRFTRMDDAHKASLAEIAFFADYVAPVVEHLQTHNCEPHFGRIAVVHADQRGRASTAALTDVALVDDHDFPRLPFGEMERNGCAHYTGAENHNVRSLRCGMWTGVAVGHAAASFSRPFFQSRKTWCAAL